jgi:CheY-like chemotaxis protein
MKSVRILFVEDDLVDQLAYERFVEEQGLAYEYTLAGSLAEAKSLACTRDFDVIVSDYSLGDGTAMELLQYAPDVPHILVTGVGDEEIATNALKAGAYDYLIKDIGRNYLQLLPERIQEALDSKTVERQAKLLAQAFLNRQQPVFLSDPQGTILFTNRRFGQVYGYSPAEILGKNTDLLGEICSEGTRSHRHKDGSEFAVRCQYMAIRDEDDQEIAILTTIYPVEAAS